MHSEHHTPHRVNAVLPERPAISAVMTGTRPVLAQSVFKPGLVKFEMHELSDRDVRDLSVSVLTPRPTFRN